MKTIRQKLYLQLLSSAWPHDGLSPLNKAITVFILVSIISVVLETEETIYQRAGSFFNFINYVFLAIFTVEYLTRLWVIGNNPKYAGVMGRLKFVFSFAALVDLAAILPFYFGLGGDAFLIRVFRLFRIFRLAKIGKVTTALNDLINALKSRSYELGISVGIAGFILLLSATLMYVLEGEAQPESFGSIPRALWWAVITLTTVGYGDVSPITPLGQMLAGVSAIAGIGLIAMPTGILAAAFSEFTQSKK